MRVTHTVHELINYLKQYEKYYPVAGETTVNSEPDNLSSYKISVMISVDRWLNSYNETYKIAFLLPTFFMCGI